jgi:hypothetical protein
VWAVSIDDLFRLPDEPEEWAHGLGARMFADAAEAMEEVRRLEFEVTRRLVGPWDAPPPPT